MNNSTEFNLEDICIANKSSIANAIQSLNKSGLKIVLVQDDKLKFVGTITDGDIRRGLLRGLTINDSVVMIVNSAALTVADNVSKIDILELMRAKKVYQIPVIDKDLNILGLHLWDEISEPIKLSNVMVIMAGGVGSRLKPLTNSVPKPMLRVNNQPILEKILLKAKSQGLSKFIVTINYLAEQIENYFKDGSNLDIEITYLKENLPLGTAGSLKMIKFTDDLPILLTNGDVVTETNYVELLNFHSDNKFDLTVAVKSHEWNNPYGVVKTDGIRVIDYIEKPSNVSLVNAGIYCLNPKIIDLIDTAKQFDMSELIVKCLDSNLNVGVFLLYEKWIDIGRQEDFQLLKSQGDL
jgi:dTDP-glucose pyrophosphorylase/predicted transcriptional regulator